MQKRPDFNGGSTSSQLGSQMKQGVKGLGGRCYSSWSYAKSRVKTNLHQIAVTTQWLKFGQVLGRAPYWK